MYEEKNYKWGINWVSLIIKIVLFILFILFLIWLFPKNDLNVFYDKIYSDNIQTMKDAARNYFTTDRLPVNVGDSKKMTLKQMVDNKMLIQFKDKDNNVCDEASSFVEVTKSGENEYVLKVQLNCGEQKDYILETIGCNDVCPEGKCEQPIVVAPEDDKEEDEEEYEDEKLFSTTTYYKHRKPITTTKTEFSCPDGYTLKGNKCVKTNTLVQNANKYEGETKVEYVDPIKTKVNANTSCPEGYESNGSYCVKYTDSIEVLGPITYVCPDSSYTLQGATCVKTYNATYVSGTTNYTCPTGYELSGTKCVTKVNATKKVDYTCPAGYDRNGTSCYRIQKAEEHTSTKCPDGYSPSGNKCVKTTTDTVDGTPKTTYGAWKFINTQYYTVSNKAYTGTTSKLVYEGMVTGAVCGTPCGNKGIWYKYSYYTRTATTTYDCPTGYTPSGSKCVKTVTDTKDPIVNKTYTCPAGFTPYGNNECRREVAATENVSYSCPSGYDRDGTTCIRTIDATPSSTSGYYTCPQGGDLVGNKCVIKKAALAKQGPSTRICKEGTLVGDKCVISTPLITEDVYAYTCPAGYDKSGEGANTKCSKVIASEGGYYCSNTKATLVGDKCHITVYDTIDATANVKTVTSYKYTWSTKSSLEGWEFTGETKTETKQYTAFQK